MSGNAAPGGAGTGGVATPGGPSVLGGGSSGALGAAPAGGSGGGSGAVPGGGSGTPSGGGGASGGGGGTSGGATSPSANAPVSSADLAAFCKAEKTLERGLQAVDTNAPPPQLRSTVLSARATFDPVLSASPSEVKGDVRVVTDAFGQLFAALDQAGYDVSKVQISAMSGLSGLSLPQASDRINAYVARSC